MATQGGRNDPLFHGFEMPLQATYYPLGFPLEVATNSCEVLEAAEESWGLFRKAFAEPLLQLRVGVLDSDNSACSAQPVVRAQRSLLARVADPENFSVSDIRQGFAFVWLTRATVENRGYLRWHFLEGPLWDLLDPYMTPLHAACVRAGDRGILLCGDSGAGKSSLALACALGGWTYLADDSCCLPHRSSGRLVIGNPYQIRFRESAATLFPQLKDHQLTRRATGELALELPTAALPGIKIATECVVDFIVFLNRGQAGNSCLLPFPKDKALRWFEQVIRCDEGEIVDSHMAALRRLLGAEVLQLRYTRLESAVQQLAALAQVDVQASSAVTS